MFNDLLVRLEEEGYQAYAYADDLAIIGKERDSLEKAIKIVEKWTEDNQMRINKKKSGIIFFRKKKKKIAEGEEGNQDILGYPILEYYKYLGIWIDYKMSFDKQFEVTKEKIVKGMKMINIMKWKKCSAWKKTYAWMT